ncbi:histidine phosphatase family protein [Virgibacillus sp. NKC19-16]|uniref:histidine phosphatase family protein n=1 Tax=Virgibacillus salidurans TaxID=2831673 RepID=UPI001F37C4E4|nr:histidine phosphatase family protein [Virgibacillus sp. NKC19-16]UJL48360.1 histidine phosphatase family protein [Virgibacillus sp. NKC19-16]
MTTICLIRHGETDWNAGGRLQGMTDIPLNDKGIRQAEECAAFLRAVDYDVLIASPLKRAKRTAEIINNKLNLPFVEMEDFKERAFGDAERMTMEERLTAYPDKNFPNQEESEAFTHRVMAGIDTITQNYPDKSVLLVAHGAVINVILTVISNGEIGADKTKLLNACISNIHYQENQWNVKNFNLVDHLS